MPRVGHLRSNNNLPRRFRRRRRRHQTHASASPAPLLRRTRALARHLRGSCQKIATKRCMRACECGRVPASACVAVQDGLRAHIQSLGARGRGVALVANAHVGKNARVKFQRPRSFATAHVVEKGKRQIDITLEDRSQPPHLRSSGRGRSRSSCAQVIWHTPPPLLCDDEAAPARAREQAVPLSRACFRQAARASSTPIHSGLHPPARSRLHTRPRAHQRKHTHRHYYRKAEVKSHPISGTAAASAGLGKGTKP